MSRVVLVTGGTRGLGRAIAQAFVDNGDTVVVCARKAPTSTGPGSFVACDVRSEESVRALIDSVMDHHGRLDVVVNNAGGAPYALAADAPLKLHQSILNLNLVGPLIISLQANTIMQTQPDGGVIINVSSVASHRPAPGSAPYAAAKAAIESLTMSLAAEWAPRVRVNCVVSGLIRTEMAADHYGDADGVAAVGRVVPMGRIAEPEEIASTFVFLASPAARYITGANVPVHGGGELPAFLLLQNVDR